jgi:hypothetical protein
MAPRGQMRNIDLTRPVERALRAIHFDGLPMLDDDCLPVRESTLAQRPLRVLRHVSGASCTARQRSQEHPRCPCVW